MKCKIENNDLDLEEKVGKILDKLLQVNPSSSGTELIAEWGKKYGRKGRKKSIMIYPSQGEINIDIIARCSNGNSSHKRLEVFYKDDLYDIFYLPQKQ
ncbi:MAG: hypothetical protein JSW73_03255 [Candidatus Woesearchaeota archaeon]|nr:MAG: hypothetical protein JSW73_03255 [Candidatus Woesearchaeota archaeon]